MRELEFAHVVTIIGTILTIIWLSYVFCGPEKYLYAKSKKKRVSVQVLVLGDLGRSPRMTYHALSIAKHGGRVDLIGYLGTYSIYFQLPPDEIC
jgi:beta-1,4-mannosyltransferase